MTWDLLALADWLKDHRVTRGHGEHRGLLEAGLNLLEDEFRVWVVNAHHMKAVPGRKTDVEGRWANGFADLLRQRFLAVPASFRTGPSRNCGN